MSFLLSSGVCLGGLARVGSASRGSAWGVSASGESASVGGSAFGGEVGQTPLLRYYKIRSTSGRYASYWNAFLSDECF